MSEPLVGAVAFRAMLEAFGRIGLDARRIQQETRLQDAEVADPDRLLPASRMYRMWEVADRLWNRPGLGLAAGPAVPMGAYEVLDYLVLTGATLGEGLSEFFNYFAVATQSVRYEVHDDGALVSCEMVWLIVPTAIAFQLRDYSLAGFAYRAHEAAGCWPVRMEVAGPLLAPLSEYSSKTGGATVVQTERNALVFSRQCWNAPLPRRDDYLKRTLRRHADHLLAQSEAAAKLGLADRVRAELLRSARLGLPSLEEVARSLGMGARTLQRQLREEGTTYAGIMENARANLASEYLTDDRLSIGEVAYLLGFSEPSAFSRAFRRWTGTSPQEFRAARA
jgi:AraC-like DNA-binding protein